jgi:hypothetical protein
MEKTTTKKAASKKVGCGGCSTNKGIDEKKLAKAIGMFLMTGQGKSWQQIEDTADYIIGRVYESTEA